MLICAAIVLLCLALKLPSLTYPRLEYDERIYWQLTDNWLKHGTYSLRGTQVLRELPPSVYDKPLFHHPPLLPILLAPCVWLGSPNAAILVAWLGHVLAIIGVAIICWMWRRRSWRATTFVLWLPVLGVALDPVLTFTARKIWIDPVAGGLAGLAMGLCALAAHHRSPRWAALAGVVFGLAGRAKLSALLVLPAGILLLGWGRGAGPNGPVRTRTRTGMMLACALPAGIVLLPWFVVFYGHYHRLLPDWIRPDAALIAASPHVAREMDRPWRFYFTQSALVSPVVLVVVVAVFQRARRLLTARLGLPVLWVGLVLIGLLGLRALGHGAQLRYLTPALPGVYVALAALLGLASAGRSVLGPVALLSVIYGAVAMGYFLYPDNLRYDDIVPLPEIIWRMWTEPPPGALP